MADYTVDYGIDLGTTNSAIARMGPDGPQVVQNNDQQSVTPSVVGMSSKGEIKVGLGALRPKLQPQQKFKRLMGSPETLTMADGSAWLPERLSAEVLKDLKASARRRFNEDVDGVVVSVPAMFNQPQCHATQEAVRLAGMRPVALLPEPIAAATAFLNHRPEEGYFLVYDLGGGTFDCSLLEVAHGEINVVEHGGNNFLGGTDLDRALFEWILGQIRRKGGETAQFEEKGPERFLLFQESERARIALSDQTEVLVDLGDFALPIDALPVTRIQLEALMEPLVDQTLDVVNQRLKNRGIEHGDVRAILLVGGPTQTPYVRERLAETGVPISFTETR